MKTIKRCAIQILALTSLSGVALTMSPGEYIEPNHDAVMDIRPNAPLSPAGLIEANECWTGPAPEGSGIPGHVVIRPEGSSDVRLGGAGMVREAFAQLFDGADTDHKIFAFCP